MITDGMSLTQSYVFWSWWFSKERPSTHVLEGYTFPGSLSTYNEFLNGRECPFCHGDQFFHLKEPTILDGVSITKGFCLCVILREMEEKYDIESEYRSETLEGFKPFGAQSQSINYIKTEVQHFIERPAMWYYLYGGYGSGKTHLLSVIKSKLRGFALYITATDLNGLVFTATNEHKLDYLIADIAAAPVLLLDDLGTEHSSAYLYTALYTIINARYIRGMNAPIFVTSNLTQADLMISSNENMRRIGSRLNDRKLVIPLITKQEDYRLRQDG